jgi:hypothetical protein
MTDPKITDDFTPPTEHKAEQTIFYAFYRGKSGAWFLGPNAPTRDAVVRNLSHYGPFEEARIFSMRLPAPWSNDA